MIEGFVTKINGNNTVYVTVVNVSKHPVYGKVIRKEKKVACQFSNIELCNGDRVMIESCRPYSKKKRHMVVKKVSV